MCQDGRETPAGLRLEELFDTAGLGEELEARGLRPATRVDRNPGVDMVTRYRKDGSIGAIGVWGFEGDSAAAFEIVELLTARARRAPPLLWAQGYRTRLDLTPRPRMRVGRPIECQPHVIHRGNEPPTGLPDSVRTWIGRAYVRAGNDTTVEVRVDLDASGAVTKLRKEQGTEEAYVEAAAIIRGLRFDPALVNGEAVPGTLRLAFAFRRAAPGTEEAADSIFLARRGFDARRAFRALVRERGADRLPADADGCVPRVRLNGVEMDRAEVEPQGPGGRGWTAVELYGSDDSPVADADACATLLLWSRTLASTHDEPLVGTVRGAIELPEGFDEPWRSVSITLEPTGRRLPPYLDGRFTIPWVAPGAYTLRVLHEDAELVRADIVVRVGENPITLDARGR